jgi:hypothetical protein
MLKVESHVFGTTEAKAVWIGAIDEAVWTVVLFVVHYLFHRALEFTADDFTLLAAGWIVTAIDRITALNVDGFERDLSR